MHASWPPVISWERLSTRICSESTRSHTMRQSSSDEGKRESARRRTCSSSTSVQQMAEAPAQSTETHETPSSL